MISVKRQVLGVVLSALLAGLPALASTPGKLVGVAQGEGAIQINGQPFGGQASLFSGDQILTGTAAPLTVISSASERFRFEPGTAAQVTKDGQTTVIALASGTVNFLTGGALVTDLPEGVTVRPAPGTATMAQVNRLSTGFAEIAVYKGVVQVADPTETLTVTAGHTAVFDPAANAQNGNQDQQKKKKKKKLWALFFTLGLSGGATAAIIANEGGRTVSVIDP